MLAHSFASDGNARNVRQIPTYGKISFRIASQFKTSIARQKQRGFYTYRYFDLPEIACVVEHNVRLESLPVEECCGVGRPIDAFIFRDWWSLYSRWEFDLRELKRAIAAGLQRGGDVPRPFDG
jgi:hypothetical protein